MQQALRKEIIAACHTAAHAPATNDKEVEPVLRDNPVGIRTHALDKKAAPTDAVQKAQREIDAARDNNKDVKVYPSPGKNS